MLGVKTSKKQTEEPLQVLKEWHSDFNSKITDNLARFSSQMTWSCIFFLEFPRQMVNQIERDLEYYTICYQ